MEEEGRKPKEEEQGNAPEPPKPPAPKDPTPAPPPAPKDPAPAPAAPKVQSNPSTGLALATEGAPVIGGLGRLFYTSRREESRVLPIISELGSLHMQAWAGYFVREDIFVPEPSFVEMVENLYAMDRHKVRQIIGPLLESEAPDQLISAVEPWMRIGHTKAQGMRFLEATRLDYFTSKPRSRRADMPDNEQASANVQDRDRYIYVTNRYNEQDLDIPEGDQRLTPAGTIFAYHRTQGTVISTQLLVDVLDMLGSILASIQEHEEDRNMLVEILRGFIRVRLARIGEASSEELLNNGDVESLQWLMILMREMRTLPELYEMMTDLPEIQRGVELGDEKWDIVFRSLVDDVDIDGIGYDFENHEYSYSTPFGTNLTNRTMHPRASIVMHLVMLRKALETFLRTFTHDKIRMISTVSIRDIEIYLRKMIALRMLLDKLPWIEGAAHTPVYNYMTTEVQGSWSIFQMTPPWRRVSYDISRNGLDIRQGWPFSEIRAPIEVREWPILWHYPVGIGNGVSSGIGINRNLTPGICNQEQSKIGWFYTYLEDVDSATFMRLDRLLRGQTPRRAAPVGFDGLFGLENVYLVPLGSIMSGFMTASGIVNSASVQINEADKLTLKFTGEVQVPRNLEAYPPDSRDLAGTALISDMMNIAFLPPKEEFSFAWR